MKVDLFKRDTNDACYQYRLGFPARVLKAQGYEITERADALHGIWRDEYLSLDGGRTPVGPPQPRLVGLDTDADVVVFPRIHAGDTVVEIPKIQALGVAVVVELDDDFGSLPRGHVGMDDTLGRKDPNLHRRWLAKACEMADLVTCSTPALAERYAPHGRVVILPNLVPAWYLSVEVPRYGDTVGWTGWTSSHVDDLRVVGDGVARALRATGAQFRHIGPEDATAEQLSLTPPEVTTTGRLSMAEYPAAFAGLDVAIAPLQPNPFNDAKSWLKVLEAAALGVSCIGSPSPEYLRARDEGLCVIASSPDEWAAIVKVALRSSEDTASYRREAAAAFTYEEHAERWWVAWSQALANRREAMAA